MPDATLATELARNLAIEQTAKGETLKELKRVLEANKTSNAAGRIAAILANPDLASLGSALMDSEIGEAAQLDGAVAAMTGMLNGELTVQQAKIMIIKEKDKTTLAEIKDSIDVDATKTAKNPSEVTKAGSDPVKAITEAFRNSEITESQVNALITVAEKKPDALTDTLNAFKKKNEAIVDDITNDRPVKKTSLSMGDDDGAALRPNAPAALASVTRGRSGANV